MLALLDRPDELDRASLANQLRDALGAASARDAIVRIVHATFDDATVSGRLMRDVILMPALRGDKRVFSASRLNMSTRTFFRRRATAVGILARAIERVLNAGDPRSDFKYETAQLISAVKPAAVKGLLEREAQRMGGKGAYGALLLSLRNGQEVPRALLDQCTGHWRLLAELEIARHRMTGDGASAYQEARTAIHAALDQIKGPAREILEFVLAYVDRLDAVRRCDIARARSATERLRKYTGTDFHFRALAAICSAEQACDEGDLAKADAIIAEVQGLTIRLNDFRIAGRTSHAASIVALVRGDYVEAGDLSRLTMAALDHIEPEFALCATGILGRAQLMLSRHWERPDRTCQRFPQSYVTAFVDCVAARHLAVTDPGAAFDIVERAGAIARARDAGGVLAYAEGTKAVILELLGKRAAAQTQRIAAWHAGMPLRRPFYLFDYLIHPALPVRAFGAFDLDDAFLEVVERRFIALLDTPALDAQRHLVSDAIVDCLGASFEGSARERRALLRRRRNVQAGLALRHSALREREILAAAFSRIAHELAYCLPVSARSGFEERFAARAAELLGSNDERRAQTI